ncbi:MAG: histidine phosphatase family protein [Salinicola sp.]|uniref:histidine phosphatase family protein n=1 Tax=Salinicola sp. TaxID=1978524 RepID=UPI001E168ACA|nr:histidine phosphatase family protein [Salinicola sp.]NRB54585.1 histidine phosphatase family protein [Salinicola sp.]
MPTLIRRPFVFLRHGQSTRNLERRIGGQHDVALTPRGEEEARRARALLGDVDWSLVASSPLQRAYRTAELALGRAPDRVVDGLMERHWGELEGQTIPDTIPYLGTPAGGESWETFVERIATTLNALLEEADTPLIVGHSGLVRAVRGLIHGSPAGPRSANAIPLWIAPTGGDQWVIRDFTPADRTKLQD